MSTDPDIQFGELEEEQPDVELRPDRNAHYAVVAYGEPEENDLPIFVDLDTLIDMESHALTDTSVELGGVMLGGQCVDEEGNPYVVVLDSLRAEHFEATKGSFKFTHDTFAKFTRQREHYPEDWDQVGWYHTHPDWGVFLSGMDMFICDHHFNKQLDVALVIDPCRQDRGFFFWTNNPRERKRRVDGFYIIASRHRQAELEQFVAELAGGYTMRTDPNVRAGYNVSGSGGAPTIVNITEQRPGWMGQAIVGMLFVQMLMLILFYFALSQRPLDENNEVAAAKLQQRERDVELKTSTLNEFMENFTVEDDVVSKLQEKEREIAKLHDEVLVREKALPQFKSELEKLKKDLKDAQKSADSWKQSAEKKSADIARLDAELKAAKSNEAEESAPQPWYGFFTNTKGITILVVFLVFVGVISAIAMKTYGSQDQFPEDFEAPPLEDPGAPDEQEGASTGDEEPLRMDGEPPNPDETPRDDHPRG